jgi:uncharacterized protein
MRRISSVRSWLLLCAVLSLGAGASGAATIVFANRKPLASNAFYKLPLGTVRPRGWLRQQLEIQANGMSGHLDEFWPDLSEKSAWLGGGGEGWERGPYYVDGLVPLAYLTGDPTLLRKAQKWINWTLEHQRSDGAIGPEKNQDWWPNMLMLKALTQYQEATGDARVIPLMEKYFTYQLARIDQRPLTSWAQFRWQDEVLSILWLYNRTGDAKLLDLVRKLEQQGHDWKAQFADFQYTGKVDLKQITLATHGVNNAMALKTEGEWYLVSRSKADRDAVYKQLRELDRYHMIANGVYSCDEHYAGNNPSQGTELCSVVEEMFSLEELAAILGDANFGDRLEKIAYNALPGTFTADMWAHQYDQQANQVLVDIQPRQWTNNKPDSNIFGLEPNFGCCTANFHQGWPKFVSSLWMQPAKGGLATVAYGPSEVEINGAHVVEETNYPFDGSVKLRWVSAPSGAFPLELRIPEWAEGSEVRVNGHKENRVKPGAFHKISRHWKAGDVVELQFPMRVRSSRWFNNSIALERGPLVFSLKIGTDWQKIRDNEQGADWAASPRTPWNYALLIDEKDPEKSVKVEQHALASYPYSLDGVPVQMEVKARRLPEWKIAEGSAGTLPESPVATDQPVETVTLIPYGAAKLRITEFPILKN